jgi:hypothetical protein
MIFSKKSGPKIKGSENKFKSSEREKHPEWRPFLLRQSKKAGQSPLLFISPVATL